MGLMGWREEKEHRRTERWRDVKTYEVRERKNAAGTNMSL